MEFYISEGATLPILKMQYVKDGVATIDEFNSLIEGSTIYFSMKNVENGSYKILNKISGFVEKTFIDPNSKPEYYIYYKFDSLDTNTPGLYEGEFTLLNDEGTQILPIQDKLFIRIGKKYVN